MNGGEEESPAAWHRRRAVEVVTSYLDETEGVSDDNDEMAQAVVGVLADAGLLREG